MIDKDKNYRGGVIIPGVKISMEALASRAAQLFKVSFEAPKKVIGTNTSDCMTSGLVLGNASCIDGMIDRFIEEIGYDCKVIATGGLSNVIVPLCKHEIIIDDTLLLKGLKVIYDQNRMEEN